MDKLNLIELGERYPDLQIVIRLGDLIEAIKVVHNEVVENYEKRIAQEHKAEQEASVSSKQAMEMLGVTKPTLWRWKNEGYLVPFKIGAKNRYRMSDIERIKKQQ